MMISGFLSEMLSPNSAKGLKLSFAMDATVLGLLCQGHCWSILIVLLPQAMLDLVNPQEDAARDMKKT